MFPAASRIIIEFLIQMFRYSMQNQKAFALLFWVLCHRDCFLGGNSPRVILGKVFNSYDVKYMGNVCPKISGVCPAMLIVSDVLVFLVYNEGRHVFNLKG